MKKNMVKKIVWKRLFDVLQQPQGRLQPHPQQAEIQQGSHKHKVETVKQQ